MIKYRASFEYNYSVEAANIIRETEKTVTFEVPRWGGGKGERRESKLSSGVAWFDDFEKAKQHVVEVMERRVANLKQQTNDLNSRLGQFRKITKPDQAL